MIICACSTRAPAALSARVAAAKSSATPSMPSPRVSSRSNQAADSTCSSALRFLSPPRSRARENHRSQTPKVSAKPWSICKNVDSTAFIRQDKFTNSLHRKPSSTWIFRNRSMSWSIASPWRRKSVRVSPIRSRSVIAKAKAKPSSNSRLQRRILRLSASSSAIVSNARSAASRIRSPSRACFRLTIPTAPAPVARASAIRSISISIW